jgi:lipopolysaccharide export LptBFGC system permease protein LptF
MQELPMSYTDFITVMLTAVTVVITILAIFIAILALWGYSQFQKMTEAASAKHLETQLLDGPFAAKVEATIIKHVSEQLEKGELRKLLADRIDQILLNDAAKRAENSTEDKPFTD